MIIYKYWNNKKYCLNNGYFLECKYNGNKLAHDVWNFYNSNNRIIKEDGNVIHHINGNRSDDRIENLQKMIWNEHNSLHHRERITNKGNFKNRLIRYNECIHLYTKTTDNYQYRENLKILRNNKICLYKLGGIIKND